MQDTNTRAHTRTWQTVTRDRLDGAVIQTRAHTITLTRTAHGIEATVNGQPAPLEDAVSILQGADSATKTGEQLEIGKPRAARLHRLMARAGIPTGEHYAFAAAALDRPVYSLAALTEPDARAVWHFLQATSSSAA